MSVTPQATPNPATTDWVPLWTLGNPSVPCAGVVRSTAQTFASGAMTAIGFDAEKFDTDGIHDPATNPSRLTCRTAGKYAISGSILWGSNATGARELWIHLNGGLRTGASGAGAGGGIGVGLSAACILDMIPGEYVELMGRQWSGANLDLIAGYSFFEMALIAPPLGSPFSTGPKVTTGPVASGPPASPVDGDIWIADLGNGVRWHFQYNAASASAYKWEFIGGAPAMADVQAGESTPSTAYSGLSAGDNGPGIVVPRAGDYLAQFSADSFNGTNGAINYVSVRRGAAATSDNDGSWGVIITGNVTTVQHYRSVWVTGLAANDGLRLYYKVNAGTGTFRHRELRVTPVRVA